MLRRLLLGLLALGALLIVAEGAIIGYRYVWLDPQAPWLLRLMLPGMFIGLAVVLGVAVWAGRRGRAASPPTKTR